MVVANEKPFVFSYYGYFHLLSHFNDGRKSKSVLSVFEAKIANQNKLNAKNK